MGKLMQYKYKTVSLRTIKGIESAEKLQANGWTIYSHGLDTLYFQKQMTSKELLQSRKNFINSLDLIGG
jgi:hypothetical protein